MSFTRAAGEHAVNRLAFALDLDWRSLLNRIPTLNRTHTSDA